MKMRKLVAVLSAAAMTVTSLSITAFAASDTATKEEVATDFAAFNIVKGYASATLSDDNDGKLQVDGTNAPVITLDKAITNAVITINSEATTADTGKTEFTASSAPSSAADAVVAITTGAKGEFATITKFNNGDGTTGDKTVKANTYIGVDNTTKDIAPSSGKFQKDDEVTITLNAAIVGKITLNGEAVTFNGTEAKVTLGDAHINAGDTKLTIAADANEANVLAQVKAVKVERAKPTVSTPTTINLNECVAEDFELADANASSKDITIPEVKEGDVIEVTVTKINAANDAKISFATKWADPDNAETPKNEWVWANLGTEQTADGNGKCSYTVLAADVAKINSHKVICLKGSNAKIAKKAAPAAETVKAAAGKPVQVTLAADKAITWEDGVAVKSDSKNFEFAAGNTFVVEYKNAAVKSACFQIKANSGANVVPDSYKVTQALITSANGKVAYTLTADDVAKLNGQTDVTIFGTDMTVSKVTVYVSKAEADAALSGGDDPENPENPGNNGGNDPGYVVITPNDTTAATTEAPEVVTGANGESVEAPKDVIPSGATLEAKEQTKEEAVKAVEAVKATDANKEVVETVKKAIEDAKAAVMDINLVKDGQKVQPNGTIKVTIKVPEALKSAANLFVYRVEADGTFTDVKATVKDGKIEFTTSHFSTYIITSEALTGDAVVTEAAATTTAPAATTAANGNAATDDKNQATGVVLAVIPAMLAAAGVVAAKKRK